MVTTTIIEVYDTSVSLRTIKRCSSGLQYRRHLAWNSANHAYA